MVDIVSFRYLFSVESHVSSSNFEYEMFPCLIPRKRNWYELVRLLAQKGRRVYLASRNKEKGTAAQIKLEKEHGVKVEYVHLDVKDQTSIVAAKEAIEKENGRLDTLVNNAGTHLNLIKSTGMLTYAGIQPLGHAAGADLSAYHDAFETNLFSLISTTNIFLPLLRQSSSERGHAIILNVTSELSSNTSQANPSIRIPGPFSAYSTSKAALNSYSIALAHELKDENIRVNAVTPGLAATKLNSYFGNRTAEDGAKVLLPFALLEAEEKEKTGSDIDHHHFLKARFYGPNDLHFGSNGMYAVKSCTSTVQVMINDRYVYECTNEQKPIAYVF
ncbi:hypothetical protein GYMLUDRAFT_63264 [Collybiopsis luxurians FD-317 M1]|uniref:Uncharacterized protein n=1 Tax=Collybiopsis luxurians FD-317 M1 TaxID=944289 RepID=A0A0D0AUV5_9AGAR|nr:hypothetical protein GYMLUDRAFT_63264 [Collybiopsis luxurians FD-317 M1]